MITISRLTASPIPHYPSLVEQRLRLRVRDWCYVITAAARRPIRGESRFDPKRAFRRTLCRPRRANQGTLFVPTSDCQHRHSRNEAPPEQLRLHVKATKQDVFVWWERSNWLAHRIGYRAAIP